MTTIGYATLQIVPSLKGVSASINKQLADERDMGKAAGRRLGENISAGVLGSAPGQKIGKELSSEVGKGADDAAGQVKTRLSERLGAQVGSVVGKGIGSGIRLGITAGAAAAAVAVGGIGLALSKGFDRLKSIDQAKFKLEALGNSAADVQTIMDNALASVKGTAFGLQDAATAAASAVAAGIKPGQDLTKYLGEVGDAAAVAGTSFEDMGSIFNKIQTSNKAYTDDLQQLSDRGLPIFQWLQKEYGVTGDKLTEMVEKGEVDAAHFQEAIETNIGGAAQKMGQSFDGAVDNMEASVARLGANFITAILGGDPANALQGPTQAIELLTTKFDDISAWVNAHSGEIRAFFIDIKDYAVQAAGAVKSIGEFLLEHKGILEASAAIWVGWKAISATSAVLTSVQGIATALGLIGPAATTAGAEASTALSAITAPAWLIALLAGGSVAASDAFNEWSNAHPERQQHDPEGRPAGDPNSRVRSRANTTGLPTGPKNYPDAPYVPTPARSGSLDGPSIGGGAAYAPPSSGGYQIPGKKKLFGNGYATGGSIFGAGSATSDSIPALLSNGEHVWTASEVNQLGGQGAMYRLRGMVKSGLLKGFDTGGSVSPINPDLLNIMLGRSGQGDNWARYDTYDPMQHALMYRNMVGVDPSGLRTPGGGLFNPGMRIDTSNVSFSKPKYPYDKNALLFEDLADITTYQKGEFNNPSYFERKAISNNDPLWSWIQEKGGGFADGGAVGGISVDALKRFASGISGHRYVLGGGNGASFDTDCSGAQATIANFITGGSGRFATGSEGAALLSRGFRTGDPPPGVTAYWIGWKNGGPGGGHTAGTIVDPAGGNVNVEMGGSSGGGAYGASTGASGFPNRAWIQLAGAVANATAPVTAEDPTVPDDFSGGTSSGTGSGTGSGAATKGGLSLSSSFSGLAGMGLGNLGKGVGTTGSGSDLSLFGNAAASAVSGQASSLLGAFGISDNPPILQAASQLLGGISIGGHGSAAPLSATNTMTGAPLGGDMHGGRAGQQPGPVTNIYAQDAEGALTKWQRLQDQLAARKLDHL